MLVAAGRTVDRLRETPRLLAPVAAALIGAVLLAAPAALASESLTFRPPELIDTQSALGANDPLVAVACPSSELCVAIDRGGYALISTDPAVAVPIWRAPQRIDGTNRLTSVSCPSSELCVAVDLDGNAVISTDPAAADPTWHAPVSIDGQGGLTSVSCPSSALCVAVDLDGNTVISTDPSASMPIWSTPAAIERQSSDEGHRSWLRSVSCPSVDLCVAVDRYGDALISADPAAHAPMWSPPANIDRAGDLTSVSCPSNGLCVAVDTSGSALITTDPRAATPTWSAPTGIDGAGWLSSVSCFSSELCVGVDLHGDVVVTTDPAAIAPSWSAPVRVDPVDGLSAVACPTRALCVAVDLGGSAEVGSAQAGSGSQVTLPPARTIAPTTLASVTTPPAMSTVTPAALLAPPVFAESETVRALSGTVTVRLNGAVAFVPISELGAGEGPGAGSRSSSGSGSGSGPAGGSGATSATIPNGSEVEATNGHVLITVATRTPGKTAVAGVSGGRFRIVQERGGSGETHFILTLPLTGCARVSLPRGAAAVASHRRRKHRSGPKSRHLWVYEKGGNWGTNGRYVSTSVEGTHWLTQDECVHSRVKVVSGKVEVRDLVRRRTRLLTAGQTYVAVRR